MITQLIWTIWTSLSAVPRKAVKFNHSLTQLPNFATIYQFLPEASFGLQVLSLPLSVHPSVTNFFRAITHQQFKLGSPNLDQRYKTTWSRSLLFYGTINLDLQGQIELQNQNLPHFELVHAITRHQLK